MNKDLSKQSKEEKNYRKRKLKSLVESLVEQALLKEDGVIDIFVDPFADVFKTAKHSLESSMASILGNTKKIAMQFGAAALPFVASSEISRIGEEENEKIKASLQGLDDEYADVLQRNWDTLRTRDIAGLGLMFNPTMTIGAHAAGGSATVALGVLEILTGGHPSVKNLRVKAQELTKKVMPGGGSGFGAGGGAAGSVYDDDDGYGGDFGFGESLSRRKATLLEQQPQQQQTQKGFTREQLDQRVVQLIQKLLARKDVQKALQASPITMALKTSGIDSVVERANKIATFNNMNQFETYLGNEFKTFKKQIETQIPKDTPPEELKKLEQEQVVELKKAFKTFYTKYLTDIAQKNPGTGEAVSNAMKILNKLG